ncbi:MAG: hypothetical protein HC898_06360 [Phycisphaerales bacterium]|nr:hypothetical protein [Phycisphaerales bacterium]
MTLLATPMTTNDSFHESHQALQQRHARVSPPWLRELRQQGMNHFERLGWPDSDHEEWRYTNLKPLIRRAGNPSNIPAPAPSPVSRCKPCNCTGTGPQYW